MKFSYLYSSLLLILVTFNNCSGVNFNTTKSSSVESKAQDSQTGAVDNSSTSINDPVVNTQASNVAVANSATVIPKKAAIDDLSCQRDYFTVFSWTNANLLANDAFANINFEFSPVKIKTLKKFELRPPLSPRGIGWSVSVYIAPTEGNNTATTLFIEKVSSDDQDKMDCYFSPESPVKAFLNIGLNNTPKHLVGYISNSNKFVACRVASGQKGVRILGKDGEFLDLPADKPFVIKRGCFQ